MRGAEPARPGRVETDPGGTRVFVRGVPPWPGALEALERPPERLHVRGPWHPGARAVAIVGARAATPYGLGVARALAFDLAREGLVVVSGLARGIDTAAHAGAVAAGGVTIAVLASGLDGADPLDAGGIAGAVLARGAWISEHPEGTPAHRGRFLERNRLIAALAEATVVVEAASRSGALNTAAHTRRLGRALFAVPGDIDRPTSRGCHRLLKDGARLCESAADILRALDAGAGDARTPIARLRAALGLRPLALESLARAAGLPARETLALLARLSLSGEAEARPGQTWVRRA
jgi:DNA processing protein